MQRNRTNIYKYTAAALVCMLSTGAMSQEVEQSSPLFPVDEELSSLEFHVTDVKSMVDKIIGVPSVSSPFGYDPNWLNNQKVPNPIEKVGLIRPPYSNNQGAVRMSYDFEFTPAKNGMSPDFKLTYDNQRGYGLLGMGWDLTLPKLVIDESAENWQKNYAACFIDGVRYTPKDDEKDVVLDLKNDQDVTFYAESNPYGAYLIRHSRVSYKRESDNKLTKDKDGNLVQKGIHVYWELVCPDGTKTFFGNVLNPYRLQKEDPNAKENKDKFDNHSRLFKMKEDKNDKEIADTIIAEWHASYRCDFYGNYVEYMYLSESENHGDNMPYVNTISVGNAHDYPHTIISFKYKEQKSPHDSIVKYNNYGIEYKRSQLLSSIEMKYANESNPEKYDVLRSYEFTTERLVPDERYKNHACSMTRLVQKSGDKEFATHTISYYDDKDILRRRREYYKNTEDKNILPYMLDRSMMIQTIHNPLGGCITVDYSTSDYKLPEAQVPVVEPAEVPEGDYAPIKPLQFPIDKYGHLLVMADLRVSNGISNFIHHQFEYEGQNWNEDTTQFFGYDKVLFHTMNLKEQKIQSTWAKTYEMKDPLLKDKLLSAELFIAGTEQPEEVHNLAYEINDEPEYGLGFNCVRLKSNTFLYPQSTTESPFILKYDYDTENRLYMLREENNHGPIGMAYTFNYSDEKSKGYWSRLKSVLTTQLGDNFYDVELSYEDANNPGRVTTKRQYITGTRSGEGHKSFDVNYQYDSEGNMTSVTYPADANGDRMKISFLYDRRYNMYLNKVENSLGYRSELNDYDYHYGIPRTIVDQNNVVMKQTTDEIGRITSIYSPYEIENGEDATIKYEYDMASLIYQDNDSTIYPFRDSLLTDPSENLLSTTFINDTIVKMLSFFYTLEEKDWKGLSEQELYEKFNVCTSSWDENDKKKDIIVLYDSADASKCLCHDTTLHLSYTVRMNNQGGEFLAFSDGLGRMAQTKLRRSVTYISGKSEESSEGETQESGNATLSVDGVEDEYLVRNSEVESRYQDGIVYYPFSGKVSDKERIQYVRGSDIDRIYLYDERNRVSSVLENDEEVASYSYKQPDNVATTSETITSSKYGDVIRYRDYAGRITKETYKFKYENLEYDSICNRSYSPDGRVKRLKINDRYTDYRYDVAGRNIQQSGSDGDNRDFSYDDAGNLLSEKINGELAVKYNYHLNQLTSIEYPQSPYNNISFHYGDKNAKDNAVGRVIYLEDAVGAQEIAYGSMGEVIKTRRSIVAPHLPVRTYETEWQYNSLNQMERLVLPDQEVLTYTYDVSGLPMTVFGNKSYMYKYVNDAGYDLLGNRVYLSFCNGEKEYTLINSRGESIQKQVETPGMGITMNTAYYKHTGDCFIKDVLQGSLCGYQFNQTNMTLSRGGNMLYTTALFTNPKGGTAFYEGMTDNINRVGNNFYVACRQNDLDVAGAQELSISYPYDENGCPKYEGEENYEDEESRTELTFNNGNISTYWYDYSGYPVVKTDGNTETLFSNGQPVSGSLNWPLFSFQINKYFTIDANMNYTKNIYFGDEQVVRKNGDEESYGKDPVRIEKATLKFDGVNKTDYKSMSQEALTQLPMRYAKAEVSFEDNKTDEESEGFDDSKNSNVNQEKDNYEEQQYYYHRINGESIFYISELNANVADMFVVTPFGKRLFQNWHGYGYGVQSNE